MGIEVKFSIKQKVTELTITFVKQKFNFWGQSFTNDCNYIIYQKEEIVKYYFEKMNI